MTILKKLTSIITPGNNLPKILSLILAFMFWFYIKGEETVSINKVVIPYIKVDSSMVVLDKSTTTISITLSGRKEDVERFKEKRIKAEIDLSKHKHKISVNTPLKRTAFLVPPRLHISDIKPASIDVEIDKKAEKVLPVNVVTGGTSSENYIVESAFANPSYVSVTGAKSMLDKLKAIDTVPLDITGRIKSFSTNIELTNLMPTTKTKEVRVFVNITEKLTERTFPNIPIKILHNPMEKDTATIEPQVVSVTLKGTKKNIENLTAEEIDVMVGTSALPTGQYELPVRVLPINNIHLKEIKPQVVNVGINTEQ